MKAGDRVKCIEVDGQEKLNLGQIYTVVSVGRGYDHSADKRVVLEGVVSPDNYGWYVRRFEVVDDDEVNVNIRGKIVGRNTNGVSVQINSGSVVVLPAELVPEDPKVAELREFIGKALIAMQFSATSDAVLNREYDSKLLPVIKEFINVQGR